VTESLPHPRIQRLVGAARAQSDEEILERLARLEPLPDEQDGAWERDEPWSRAEELVALGDVVRERQLGEGVGLILDRMALGDPGEMMRGMCHVFDHALPARELAEVCIERLGSERAGTRQWAAHQLGRGGVYSALGELERLAEDPAPQVAEEARAVADRLRAEGPALRIRMGNKPGASLRIKASHWDLVRKDGNEVEATVDSFNEIAIATSGLTKGGEKTNRCIVIVPSGTEEDIEWHGLYVRGRFKIADKVWVPSLAAQMFREFEPS